MPLRANRVDRVHGHNLSILQFIQPTFFLFLVAAAIAPVALLIGCDALAQTSISISPRGSQSAFPGMLTKPPGEGPFPAVVIMHDCTGLGAPSSGAPARWAETLLAAGYVVLTPDSYSTRGFADGICNAIGPQLWLVGNPARVSDAFAAIDVLAQLPYVNPQQIALLGSAAGATTTLMVIGLERRPRGPRFAAGIALHPSCANPYRGWSMNRRYGNFGPASHQFGSYTPNAPALILVGEKDDWTPADDCKRLVAASDKTSYQIELKTYAGAPHLFDSTLPVSFDEKRVNFNNARNGQGATAGADAVAWSAAVKDVTAFLAKYLKSR